MLMFFAVLLSLYTACQDSDDSSVVTELTDNNNGEEVIVFPMNDSSDCSLSKKVKMYRKKTSEVFLYNIELDEFDCKYQTLKISDKNGTLMQEWFLSDIHEDWFDSYVVYNEENNGKRDFFYRWKGDIFDMHPSDWDEYIANNQGIIEEGFHIVNVIDLQKLTKIVGDFSNACKLINIVYDGYYTKKDNSRHYGDKKAYFWLYPVASTNEYYGMAGNSDCECGVLADIKPEDDYFAIFYTNVKDVYARLRLVRDITPEKW